MCYIGQPELKSCMICNLKRKRKGKNSLNTEKEYVSFSGLNTGFMISLTLFTLFIKI